MKFFNSNNSKNIFMGKRKVEKYLKQFNHEETAQIKLLRMYIDGELEDILKNYIFDVIEIYVDGNKKVGLDLQINLRNGRRNFGIDFLEDHYETCFYVAGCTPEDVENSIMKFDYQNFDLEKLFQEVEKNNE
jgi:hypothetical protein